MGKKRQFTRDYRRATTNQSGRQDVLINQSNPHGNQTTLSADDIIASKILNSDRDPKKFLGQNGQGSTNNNGNSNDSAPNAVSGEQLQAIANAIVDIGKATETIQANQTAQQKEFTAFRGQVETELNSLKTTNNGADPTDDNSSNSSEPEDPPDDKNSQPDNQTNNDGTGDGGEQPQTVEDAIAAIQAIADKRVEKAQNEANKIVTAAEARVEALEQNVKQLEGVFKMQGVSFPNVNLMTNPTQENVGLADQVIEMVQSAPAMRMRNPKTKTVAIQRDMSQVNDFLAKLYLDDLSNGIKSPMQSKFYKDLELSMKNHGFLRGNYVTNVAGPTIGTPGSVGEFFLEVLAAWMRLTHNQHNIFWQFVVQVYNSTTQPSLSMGVPRWLNLPDPQDPNDFLLATSDTYIATPAVYGTATDSQGLESNIVSIDVNEYGLGKNVNVGTRPVYISEFHESTSLISLMGAIDGRLMQSYFSFEELLIRLQYEACTIVAYNNNSELTFNPGDVGSGADGTFTHQYADSVYTAMYEEKMPSLNDGHYFLALAPKAARQYKASLGKQYAPVTEEQRMEISNIMKAATGVEIGRVNNYFGKYNGFHIFIGNSFGVGTPGSVPTVNTSAFGAGATPTVDSFAFAPGAVGRGISLAPEIRASGVNAYGRGEAWIWLSREGIAPLDLDVNLDPAQQTRCFKVRTAINSV